MKSSFDVTFEPMVNVKVEVKDPYNLTEEETLIIVEEAAAKVADQFWEKISEENLAEIRLYQPNIDREEEISDKILFSTMPTEPMQIIDNAEKHLSELARSSYIPFASPCPSTTEMQLKNNILQAISCLKKASELNSLIFEKNPNNRGD